MKSVTAKELKNQTGKVLRRVGSGERVLITKRGKPWAVLSPATDGELKPEGLRTYQEAWGDIEKTLKTSRPRFKTWQEAMRWTRWRT
jgi:prevent-host-death family protein